MDKLRIKAEEKKIQEAIKKKYKEIETLRQRLINLKEFKIRKRR